MSECILWTGAVQSKGYGSVANGRGGTMLVHRREWERVNGPIPEGMTIDHLCMVKRCINVEHMEVVTRGENSRRAIRAQTHCKRGHPLSGENVRRYTRSTGRVHRVCRTCANDYNREWMAQHRAEQQEVAA